MDKNHPFQRSYKNRNRTDRTSPADLERGRKRRRIEQIEEIRDIGCSLMDPWEEEGNE
jgi:hypothetical protein